MGFFNRVGNLWRGFLGLWISGAEARNPEAVYESAIDERIQKHAELKKAVSGIVYLRNKVSTELEEKEKDLKEINFQLPIAVEEGEDDAALVLLQKKEQLDRQVDELRAELEKVAAQAEDAKQGLIGFAAEIDKLKREKQEMVARKATAEARIQIQDTLEGLSTEADIKALENVREHIHKLQAEADVGSEVKQDSLDSRLSRIREKAADASARAQLDELKKQMAARKSQEEAARSGQATGSVKKTI